MTLDNRVTMTTARSDALYGTQRVDDAKPLLRGWLHVVWFVASLVFGTLLLADAHGARRSTAVLIYATSVSALFGTSALYHRGHWNTAWSRRLQRLDHAMIFVLIAGTATPAFLVAAPGANGLVAVTVMWILTCIAAAIHLAWMSAPVRLVCATYVGLGWAAGLALPALWMRIGVAPGMLILVGGLLYTAGALTFHRRRPNPFPAVFGYHEVFHSYVCAAATCHYIGLTLIIS